MVEKHRNFVQAYLQCFDAAEAARRAQCGADALARPAVRRELAAQTGINPNTAQKAYRLMTEEGYVVTDGNSGSFVRLTPALREQISEELTRGLVEQFVTQAKANRLSYKKVIALVSDLWGDED